MRILMAGAAALALAASGAYAQGKGNGNGNGNGNGKGNSSAVSQGQDKGNRGGPKADRGSDRGPTAATRSNPGNSNGGPDKRIVRGADRGPDRPGNSGRGNDRTSVRVSYDDGRILVGDRDRRWLSQDRNRSLVEGCPPGLAKKRNGCNPPGQVKDRRYQRSLFGIDYLPGLFGLRNYDRRSGYYYRDGYLVRYGDRGGISSWIPLLGGALGIGNVWPSGYDSYRVPEYYVDYYDLGGPNRYRYADNVIYRVDAEDAAITSIAALITGDDFEVGQPMPRGYDVYNVPYGYRDRYYDTPEDIYRYSDGYVYRIDPETRLVAAAIDLLI